MRFAPFAGLSGAPRHGHPGPVATPSLEGFHHIALKSNDPGRLAEFYRAVLGLEEVTRHRDERGLRSVWFRVGDGLVMIERSEAGGESPPFSSDPPGLHLLALRISARDRARWVAHLEATGQPILARTDYSLYFADPDGHRMALSHWPEPSTTE